MNYATMGLAHNAQHRTDDALGVWKASGKGLRRVHENFDGWQLRKTPDGYAWQVYTPAGDLATPRRCWTALHAAKGEAERLIRESH